MCLLPRSYCFHWNIKWFGWFVFMVFNAIFNTISVVSWRSVLLVEETGVFGENYLPAASYWQALSNNVVHLALSGVRTHNISGINNTKCIRDVHNELQNYIKIISPTYRDDATCLFFLWQFYARETLSNQRPLWKLKKLFKEKESTFN